MTLVNNVRSRITELMPPGYKFKIIQAEEGSSEQFKATIRVDPKDADTAKGWLKAFEETTKSTWRVRATVSESASKSSCNENLFKCYYRCQHNTRPSSATADRRAGSKNTYCPALLTITVKRHFSKLSLKKLNDPYLPAYPTLVHLEHTHNHSLQSADALKHRKVSGEVISKFKDLYSKGHSPASALDVHKMDLQLEHGAHYFLVSADRAQCPDLQFCHRLYRQVFKKAYGAATGDKLISDLHAACDRFNMEQGETCCKIEQVKDKIALAICTPLMKRVHLQHRTSGELVFIDASGGMDRYDCRVFLILTHSVVGGLPLGCLIVTSESTEVVSIALSLYGDLLPPGAFFGRGRKGPQVFISDDSEVERKSLQLVYPEAVLVLCIFHVLQAAWRFLWDGKNGVLKEDRPYLLNQLKSMVYASSEDELKEIYTKALKDDTIIRYTKFCTYLSRVYERRHLWAVCLRSDLPVRGNNTNNYCEAAMLVLKDKVFARTRAYNTVQLADFMLTRLPAYYERRLLDIANGKRDHVLAKRMVAGKVLPKEMVKPLGNGHFEVRSETVAAKFYYVDLTTDMCSCEAGLTGAPCKHQLTIVEHFDVQSLNIFSLQDVATRAHFFKLATGSSHANLEWFQPLVNRRQSITDQPAAVVPEDLPLHFPQPSTSAEAVQEAMPVVDYSNAADEFRINLDMLFTAFLENKEELFPGVENFNYQMAKLKTPAALTSALISFGKNTGASSVIRRGMIPVQPTAVARRTLCIGGRRCLQSGRRPLSFLNITQKRHTDTDSHCLPKKKRRKAPHDLSKCIHQNENLGKCHSSKW